MKFFFAALAAFVLLLGASGCKKKQGESSVSHFKPRFVPAAKGNPIGNATTQMIDASGGKVTSEDGRIDLTIRAGVFTTGTEVSIQPITNSAPNGLGTSYRLLPEGTVFSQPATITFHLDQTQALGIDSTFVVSQHDDGLWYSQPHQLRDSAAKTISAAAKHFSNWALAQTVLLKPQQTRVMVNQQANFVPTIITMKDVDPLSDDEVMVPAKETLTNQINVATSWQVNSKNGGTPQFGYVIGNMVGNYMAPKVVPSPSQVTVSLTLELGKTKVIAPAKADIYDQETWVGSSHIKQADGTLIDATFVFAQTADDGHGHYKFNVQKGTVHATPPATLPSGCSLKVSPKDYDIGPNDGYMTAAYDWGSGGESPMVSGMGTTVWMATYTTTCPNGPGSMTAGVQAQWWPMLYGAMPTPVAASNGVYDDVVNTPMGSGTVHLVRQ